MGDAREGVGEGSTGSGGGTDCPIRLARNHIWEKISQKIGNKCYDLSNLVSFDYCGEYYFKCRVLRVVESIS